MSGQKKKRTFIMTFISLVAISAVLLETPMHYLGTCKMGTVFSSEKLVQESRSLPKMADTPMRLTLMIQILMEQMRMTSRKLSGRQG
jgi:hypothetical protein